MWDRGMSLPLEPGKTLGDLAREGKLKIGTIVQGKCPKCGGTSIFRDTVKRDTIWCDDCDWTGQTADSP